MCRKTKKSIDKVLGRVKEVSQHAANKINMIQNLLHFCTLLQLFGKGNEIPFTLVSS